MVKVLRMLGDKLEMPSILEGPVGTSAPKCWEYRAQVMGDGVHGPRSKAGVLKTTWAAYECVGED